MLTKFHALYIPTTTGVNVPADSTLIVSYRNKVKCILAEIAGGATEYETRGCWMSEIHGLVEETIYIVKAFHNGLSAEDEQKINALAEELKGAFSQECISLETEKGLNFI